MLCQDFVIPTCLRTAKCRGIQSDEIETISQQKATDEQRLILATTRHDQEFSSSRMEASRQMAAARDIALRRQGTEKVWKHSEWLI